MANKYNTGNAVGSSDLRDLYDNASNLDDAVNGSAAEWTDRKGVVRRSIAGMQDQVDEFLANGSVLTFATYAEASAAPIEIDRQVQVIGDSGTHTDPVSGASVSNSGTFVKVAAGLQWLRADVLAEKADQSEVDDLSVQVGYRATRAELIANDAAIRLPWAGMSVYEVPDGEDNIALLSTKYNGQVYKLVWYSISENKLYPDNGGGGGSSVAYTDIVTYIDGGVLKAVGGSARNWTVNADAGKSWVQTQTVGSTARAIYTDATGAHAQVVSLKSGRRYMDARLLIRTDDGQSNSGGQAGLFASVVYGEYFTDPERIRMPVGDNTLWVNGYQKGGASVALNGTEITSFGRARSTTLDTGPNGTLAVEGSARRFIRRAAADCDGWVPQMLLWTNAEGGQTIDHMLPNPDPGYYYFANIRTMLTRVKALADAEGKAALYDWAAMCQGESNPSDALTGAKHEQLRAAMEASAQELLGQTEPLRMMSSQMSSFQSNREAVFSILSQALDNEVQWGKFFCLGPTYIYPYNTADYLHHTSVGHAMRGEFMDAAIEQFDKTGYFRPLTMLSAAVTGTNQITVTMSEDVVIDATWLAPDIANAGITLAGGTVSAISASGSSLIITTAGAASAVTAVRAAYVGHGATRAASTIPRSTVRSSASIGTWSTECGGKQMYKPLCHQQISIGA